MYRKKSKCNKIGKENRHNKTQQMNVFDSEVDSEVYSAQVNLIHL